jgi:hypothetical protein
MSNSFKLRKLILGGEDVTKDFEIYESDECKHFNNDGQKCRDCGAVYNEGTLEWELNE